MLSVVIPTLNRPDSLTRLVLSLQHLNLCPDSHEVLIVYNDEHNKKISTLQNSSILKLLHAPLPGVNHARNYGALNARGEVILFLDDDCEIVDPAFLKKHIDLHRRHPELVAIGGPYTLSPKSSFYDQIYHQNNVNWIEANRVDGSRSTALLGGNASYKSYIFANGFRFTEEIKYGGSETPLNTILALKYGPHGYFPDLAVLHNTELNCWSLFRKAFLQGKGAGLQTKMYGHQLKQVPSTSTDSAFLMQQGLELYALIFSIGYQSQFSKSNLPIVFLKTITDRYIKKKLIMSIQRRLTQLYWWLYANVRHPLLVHFHHPLLAYFNKFYWFITTLPKKVYWSVYPILAMVNGFLISLYEPLPIAHNLPPLQKMKLRLIHVAKKMGWLIFKTVGLR